MVETYFTSVDPIAWLPSAAPYVAGTAVAFPPNRYDQEDVARELTTFADQGFIPMGAAAGARAGDMPYDGPLKPGDAVGVTFVTGDLELGATGTVTYIDDDKVYAFGHPMYNLGPTEFPMTRAYVYTVLPSLFSSAKLSATSDIVVMIDADGSTDPREMDRFVQALEDGADFVKGSRHLPDGGSADFTRLRAAGNKAFVLAANGLFGSKFTDLCYGYCAFWRRHIEKLGLTADGFEIDSTKISFVESVMAAA